MTRRGRTVILLTFLPILLSRALQQPKHNRCWNERGQKTAFQSAIASSHSPTVLFAFFTNDSEKNLIKNNISPRNNDLLLLKINDSKMSVSNGNTDISQTFQLQAEALSQAQSAISSLENALDSTVSDMVNMQQQLQQKVLQLEEKIQTVTGQLNDAQSELKKTQDELSTAKEDVLQANKVREELEWKLIQSQGEIKYAQVRIEELETSLASVGLDPSSSKVNKNIDSTSWKLWRSSPKSQSGLIPILNDWVVIKGSTEGDIQISGKVTNHPSIPDGDAIVTSPLNDASQAAERKIVTTSSGSKYKLGIPMVMPSANLISGDIKSAKLALTKNFVIPDLSGKTLGNGRYLLAGSAIPSVNGRSFIQTVYRSSSTGKPIGEPLIVKVSKNIDAMKREYLNYQKVSLGLKRVHFIKRMEFLPMAGEEMPDSSALVMQRGVADVKAFMPTVGGRLEGKMLNDCALTALQCVEALHAAKLVWNDLKTENFVVVKDEKAPHGVSFRGIDLESCMSVGTNPVDYTPEACPPEFAKSFLDGKAETFLLEYSYDIWSFGMFLYEISTGRGFFDGLSAGKITKMLPSFKPKIDNVPDPQLADLITQCLSQNPSDRPSIIKVSQHPFFSNLSLNKGPFDFIFGFSI